MILHDIWAPNRIARPPTSYSLSYDIILHNIVLFCSQQCGKRRVSTYSSVCLYYIILYYIIVQSMVVQATRFDVFQLLLRCLLNTGDHRKGAISGHHRKGAIS